MLYNRFLDRRLIFLIPVLLFVYLSVRPVFRLRTDMPPQFVDAPASATARQRKDEERLARAYWKVGQGLQTSYFYGSPLPPTPPDDFRISDQAAGSPDANGSARQRYWARLQQVWIERGNWTHQYEWSTEWLTHPVQVGADRVQAFVHELFHLGR